MVVVVKGNEKVLEELETQWERVQLQTGWKLEACFMPSSAPLSISDSKENDSSSELNSDSANNSSFQEGAIHSNSSSAADNNHEQEQAPMLDTSSTALPPSNGPSFGTSQNSQNHT